MQFQGNMQPDVEMAAPPTKQQPAGDLFDGNTFERFYVGGRRDYYDLYRASVKGDLKAAKSILLYNKWLVGCRITPNNESPLHLAIMSRNTEFVEYLVGMMSKSDLEMKNSDGNTAFCLAAMSGNVRMAKAISGDVPNKKTKPATETKNDTMQAIEKENEMKPLCLAAFHGRRNMVNYLYNRMKHNRSWTEHRNEVLLKCIEANMLDVAIRILEENKELPQDNHEWGVLQALAKKPEAFTSPSIISKIKSCFVPSDGIKLLRLLLERVAKKPRDKIHEILKGPTIMKDKIETHPSQILFIAAKNNKQFLVELIREFPDLIWQRNDEGQTVFHIAIAYRDHDVYKFLKNIGSIKDFITPIVDKKGNNILHMVGKMPGKIAYEDLGITACEILHEYIWYKDVEGTLPPRCRKMKNKAGHTPEEEFIKGHRKVISRGTDWIYETINQSMVVAALVCTIGFSIIFSIPGGFDQNHGFPIFRENKIFVWFILVEAISFLLSGISMLIFISVILARYEHHKEILLERWLAGQEALFASLAASTTAFLSGAFLLYRDSILPCIISGLAIVLFLTYIKEYYSLLRDGLYITFKAMYLFRLKKHIIYVKTQASKYFCYGE